MLLSQILKPDGTRQVVAREGTEAYALRGVETLYTLACDAVRLGKSLTGHIGDIGLGEAVDLQRAYDDGRILAPIMHPDPAHLHLTGTGLTHLGSAATRDTMHQKLNAGAGEELTDSMKMFQMGLKSGKAEGPECGVQPEWFYKGDGTMLAAPGASLTSPAFADDGGEEPEIAGIYINSGDGTPFRVGYALSNEFSDHVMERVNYLYLAHSKLRPAALGPEILLGDLPANIKGTSRIRRDDQVIWEKPFLSGEDNMTHSIANLEHHHFKYDLFRQPGDVHVHMFGTATLSFADGIKTRPGDIFEIEAPEFGLPLRNTLEQADPASRDDMVRVSTL